MSCSRLGHSTAISYGAVQKLENLSGMILNRQQPIFAAKQSKMKSYVR